MHSCISAEQGARARATARRVSSGRGGGGRALRVVTSAAVGVCLDDTGVEPLGLKGLRFPDSPVDDARSGVHVVRVTRGAVTDAWHTLAELDP